MTDSKTRRGEKQKTEKVKNSTEASTDVVEDTKEVQNDVASCKIETTQEYEDNIPFGSKKNVHEEIKEDSKKSPDNAIEEGENKQGEEEDNCFGSRRRNRDHNDVPTSNDHNNKNTERYGEGRGYQENRRNERSNFGGRRNEHYEQRQDYGNRGDYAPRKRNDEDFDYNPRGSNTGFSRDRGNQQYDRYRNRDGNYDGQRRRYDGESRYDNSPRGSEGRFESQPRRYDNQEPRYERRDRVYNDDESRRYGDERRVGSRGNDEYSGHNNARYRQGSDTRPSYEQRDNNSRPPRRQYEEDQDTGKRFKGEMNDPRRYEEERVEAPRRNFPVNEYSLRPRRPVPANPAPSQVLGIFGLSSSVTTEDLKEFIEDNCKGVEYNNLHLVRHKVTGESRGFAFVYFNSLDESMSARENLIGKALHDREIRVDYSISDAPRPNNPRRD